MQAQNVFVNARREFIDRESPGMRTCLVHLQSRLLTQLSIEALTERLTKLEESSGKDISNFSTNNNVISSASASPQANAMGIPEAPPNGSLDPIICIKKRQVQHDPQDIAQLAPPATKRRKSQNVLQQKTHHETHSPGSTHHASEAREHIEHELQCNPALSKDRRTALESAQKFVGQLSNPTLHWAETGAMDDMTIEGNIEEPSLTPELLYMMLPGQSTSDCK
jgi:hypothetical protein